MKRCIQVNSWIGCCCCCSFLPSREVKDKIFIVICSTVMISLDFVYFEIAPCVLVIFCCCFSTKFVKMFCSRSIKISFYLHFVLNIKIIINKTSKLPQFVNWEWNSSHRIAALIFQMKWYRKFNCSPGFGKCTQYWINSQLKCKQLRKGCVSFAMAYCVSVYVWLCAL